MSVHPITQRVRNNIIRILSDAYPEALSTPEVLAQLTKHYGCNHTFRRTHDSSRFVPASLPETCTSQPESSCPHTCWYSQAYPGLRALATQGSVEWIIRNAGPNRGAYWRYQPDPDPDVTDPPAPGPDARAPHHRDQSGLPYRAEIIDLDAPPTEPAAGQLIDAHDRFTTPPQQPRCRDCDQPATLYVLPHIDHRRRKPWPQPYWLCQAHAATPTTC